MQGSQLEIYRIIIIMGNNACNGDTHLLYLKSQPIHELTIESKEEVYRSTGSENLSCENQDFDQCSPFSKFDNFLTSGSWAQGVIRMANPHLPLLEDGRKSMTASLKKRLSSTARKSLMEWERCKIANLLNEIQKAEETTESLNGKNQNFRSYIKFLMQKDKQESKFMNIKISADSLVKIRYESITPYYSLKQKIGEGTFGSVYIGQCLITKQTRAIKILKKKIMNERDQKVLLSQINILKKMDHINIIKLYDVFFFNNNFFVITEYCEGGCLLDALRSSHISTQKHFAIIMKQLFSAVSYMHQMKIAHRDLKLENIVLVNNLKKSNKARICIKLIDFGLAQEVTFTYRNPTMLVGTIDYMAPEIFKGYYSTHSDIWSCGVILCVLLIGYNPFRLKRKQETIDKITKYEIDYTTPGWAKVSEEAKSLVKQMLVKKDQKRITIQQIKHHEWMKNEEEIQLEIMGRQTRVINSLNNYNRGSNFICYIKNFLISRELTQETRQQLAIIFEKLDTDSSGVIEKQELIDLYSLVNGASNVELEKLLDKIDQNKSGRIDFQEFLMCMTDKETLRNKMYINQAFDFIDVDRTGFIEKAELLDLLEGGEEEELCKILAEADFDGDNRISRQEFLNYLMTVEL